MRVVYFTHSLASCWNHGNVHFLRGLLLELVTRGHAVTAFEPANGWSRSNLLADHGEAALHRFSADFPELDVRAYDDQTEMGPMLEGAGLAIVHEWTEPAVVAAIGEARKRGGRFVLLFHDTHHRAVSDAEAMRRFDLSGYDGVLAFGQSLAEVYRRAGWGARAFVFHEAADIRLFKPPASEEGEVGRSGIVWIGNWGDNERSEEIAEYLLKPARAAALPVDIYGVRYPATARYTLAAYDAAYHGWLANADVPAVFARHQMTVHVPRRLYSTVLPGIPTIRVFEALACGIPLLCAPWRDSEGLFRAGQDYLVASDASEMRDRMDAVVNDAELRRSLVESGLQSIRARHTCTHRANQLLSIVASLRPQIAECV
jgi:spore maturation protein CgeB